MKVTEEMIDAFGKAVWAYPWTDAGQTELSRSEVRDALRAVLDLIEMEQAVIGVQATRDGELEVQCLRGDGNCEWNLEVRGSGDYGWVTVADLTRIDSEHTKVDHR